MQKPIEIILLSQADKYWKTLDEQVKKKFLMAFFKMKNGFKGDWFEKMTGTDDIWEFRVSDGVKWYRILSFWDKTGETETLVVCTNGFDKKSNKTPTSEIEKAEIIKLEYFKQKKS